jgi:hypothetical protein
MRRLCQGVGVSSGLMSCPSKSFEFGLLVLNKVIYVSDFCKPFLKIFYFAQFFEAAAQCEFSIHAGFDVMTKLLLIQIGKGVTQ